MRALLLAALVSLTGLSSVGLASADTLAKIKDSGTITLGVRQDARPFSFLDGQGKPAGYSVQLCQAVVRSLAKDLGREEIKIKYQAVTPENRFALLADGSVDLECGITTYSLSRMTDADFSLLIFATGADLMVRKDAAIAGIPDLGGKRVGVRSGTTSAEELGQILGASGLTAEVVPLPTYADLLASLETDEIDAVFGDRALLLEGRALALHPEELHVLGASYSYEPYALVMRRDDGDFRQAVDRALARLYRTDEVVRIYEAWFGDITANPEAREIYHIFALPE